MTEARYDAVAEFYAGGWSDAYDDPVSGSLFALLGPVRGRRILDVACGHGRITRELARRGARVIGVDLSAALLEKAIAADGREPLDVEYIQADIGGWDPPREMFDAATCCFGLSDIDDLDAAVDTIARALSRHGRFVFCLLHPCFPGAGEVSGSWPSDGTYFDERWWLPAGRASSLRRRVGVNHRMLSTYLNSFTIHGLDVDRLAEPPPSQNWADSSPTAAGFPVFLAGRCIKR